MRRAALLLALLLSACSGGESSRPPLPSPPLPARTATLAPSSFPTLPSPSPTQRRLPASPAPTRAARSSAARTASFPPLTFDLPEGWGIDAQGDVAYVGRLAGGPQDLALRLERGVRSVDALAPTTCPREGDPPVPVTSVEPQPGPDQVPVGGKPVQYRRWLVTCPASTTVHRAWFLPDAGLGIYEQAPAHEVDEVIRSARFG